MNLYFNPPTPELTYFSCKIQETTRFLRMISVIQRRTSVYTENIASSTGSDPKYQISLILASLLLLLYHHTVIIAGL